MKITQREHFKSPPCIKGDRIGVGVDKEERTKFFIMIFTKDEDIGGVSFEFNKESLKNFKDTIDSFLNGTEFFQ